MLSSEPLLDPNKSQAPLETWKRLGQLDLNDLHEKNPIDLNKQLVYQEEEYEDGDTYHGQWMGEDWCGIGRDIQKHNNHIYEGQF